MYPACLRALVHPGPDGTPFHPVLKNRSISWIAFFAQALTVPPTKTHSDFSSKKGRNVFGLHAKNFCCC